MPKYNRVAVLGLGREGVDILKFLHKLNVQPVGLDARFPDKFTTSELKELKNLTKTLKLGDGYLKDLTKFDVIFRSPGIPLDLPEIKQAKKEGVNFSSLTKLFFGLCPAPIVGVTGTKGKSTTSSLIYHLLSGRKEAIKTYFGGNIGYPPLSLISKIKPQDNVVLELSSFQLEDLDKSPHIAVMLNMSPEHLDRHKTFKNYVRAKANLLLHQKKTDWLVVSSDHPETRNLAKQAKGKVAKYSIKKILAKGLYVSGGKIVYRDFKTGKRFEIIKTKELPIIGMHNLENALAAMSVALLCDMLPQQVGKLVRTFEPLHHRLEKVGNIGKVSFVDDSLATTPIATQASIEAVAGKVGLIMGGVSKQEEDGEIINVLISNKLKGVALIGKTAKTVEEVIKNNKIKISYVVCRDLKQAVEQAYKYVSSGGTVLLAPAFASFDMFRDAYDRGDQFKKEAQKLIKKIKSKK